MSIYFLDFEASSLLPGSFPIEVAWVDENGQGESYLILPAPGWLDEVHGNPGWSRESEAIHGIALSTLLEEGEPHEHVAARAVKVLAAANVIVCSDMPVSDIRWLRTLLEAADIRTSVSISDVTSLYTGVLSASAPVAASRPCSAPRSGAACSMHSIGNHGELGKPTKPTPARSAPCAAGRGTPLEDLEGDGRGGASASDCARLEGLFARASMACRTLT